MEGSGIDALGITGNPDGVRKSSVNYSADVSSVFESLQNALVSYASGGSKNSSVISLLQSRNSSAISNMAEYWKKLV